MDDRELLEMAAKAAGIGGKFSENHPEDGAPCYSCGINRGKRVQILWNPLTDDGDALRLLVELKMDVTFFRGFEEVYVQAEGPPDTPWELSETIDANEKFSSDMAAATRRAIVRAAAVIGKAMP